MAFRVTCHIFFKKQYKVKQTENQKGHSRKTQSHSHEEGKWQQPGPPVEPLILLPPEGPRQASLGVGGGKGGQCHSALLMRDPLWKIHS